MTTINPRKVRDRIRLAGDSLNIPAAEILALCRGSDKAIRKSQRWFAQLLRFAASWGLSLDWILFGKVRAMLVLSAPEFKRPEGVAA